MRAFRIAYDGSEFRGFQRQPDVTTVEDALFDALADLDVLDGAKPAGYAAAGRTDAGVSALAQTVAFEAPAWLSPAALNGELPAAVRAWASADAPADFHATHDAAEREYTYHLYAPATGEGAHGHEGDRNGTVDGGGRGDVDDGRARDALDALAGEHDFHNCTPDETGTVRDLRTALERDGDFLVVRLRADGFARQLVRRIASLVTEVARGDADLDRIDRVLSAASLDGSAGVAPAPARPLVLTDVVYPDLSFVVDDDAAASARDVFAERHRTAAANARVAATIRDGV
ncbi:MAG: tRNA pseudouridine(38-40) synthase TruA [Haloarculaceae archaeon]